MPSRDNRARIVAERALRLLALLTLAFAAWRAAQPPREPPRVTAASADLSDALVRWTLAAPRGAHLSFDRAPAAAERDWLRALRHAGTAITWEGSDIPALAAEAAPVASPRGGRMLWIAAPPGARVAVADEVAPIDTVIAANGGARIVAPAATGPLSVGMSQHLARADVHDTLAPRRVLVLGRATWEAKFVIAALEEVGWPVDARLAVAPGLEVTQGSARMPDTARHAAVVILDAPSAATASAIARYVRSGGGAVLSGAAANAGSLADIAVGRSAARVRPSSIAFADDAPRRALGFLAIAPRSDAIPIEGRDGRVAAAARRVDLGRVVQLGYDETWRWRLAGGASALDAHRDWWSSLLASVAYRAAIPTSRDDGDDAPRARLVDALGPPSSPGDAISTGARWSPPPALLFAVVSMLLLAELSSRRLRGAP
jgi:hypothetical protein